MADYTRREVVTRRIEYVLPNPTNWAEVSKVLTVINHETDRVADDFVRVEGRDDEIVFSFEAVE